MGGGAAGGRLAAWSSAPGRRARARWPPPPARPSIGARRRCGPPSLFLPPKERLSSEEVQALAGVWRADLDLDDVGTHVRDLIIALERAARLPTSAGFVANPLGVHA